MGWTFEQGSLSDPRPKHGRKYYSFSEPVEAVIDRLVNKGKENWDELDTKEYEICISYIKEKCR